MVGAISLHAELARPSHWSCRAYTHYNRPSGGCRHYSSTSISVRSCELGLRVRFASSRGVARADGIAACCPRRVERVSAFAPQTSRRQLLKVAVVDDPRRFIRLNGHLVIHGSGSLSIDSRPALTERPNHYA